MANQSVNYAVPNDRTIRVFDKFYNFDIEVDAGQYDLVYSFVKRVFDDDTAARNFTTSLFQVSEQSGVPVTELIKDMEGQNSLQLTASIAYFLNNFRSNSTLLGVSETFSPNLYAARNVLT